MNKILSILLIGFLFSVSACHRSPHYSSKSSIKKKHDYYNMHELDQKRRDKELIKEMKKN
jgi:hypothetical protein